MASVYLSACAGIRPPISMLSAKDEVPRRTWIRAPGTVIGAVVVSHEDQQAERKKPRRKCELSTSVACSLLRGQAINLSGENPPGQYEGKDRLDLCKCVFGESDS